MKKRDKIMNVGESFSLCLYIIIKWKFSNESPSSIMANMPGCMVPKWRAYETL